MPDAPQQPSSQQQAPQIIFAQKPESATRGCAKMIFWAVIILILGSIAFSLVTCGAFAVGVSNAINEKPKVAIPTQNETR